MGTHAPTAVRQMPPVRLMHATCCPQGTGRRGVDQGALPGLAEGADFATANLRAMRPRHADGGVPVKPPTSHQARHPRRGAGTDMRPSDSRAHVHAVDGAACSFLGEPSIAV